MNVTPEHFSTSKGEPVLSEDSDGFPRPVPTEHESAARNGTPHLGRIALAIYENIWAAGSGELDTVADWVRQYNPPPAGSDGVGPEIECSQEHAWSITARLASLPADVTAQSSGILAALIQEAKELHPDMAASRISSEQNPDAGVAFKAQREPFKALVLKHMTEHLPRDQWNQMRTRAVEGKPIHPSFKADATLSPEDFLDAALSEDDMSVNDTLTPAFKARSVVIGTLLDQPVYHVEDSGIYVWGQSPDSRPVFMLWLSHPVYPPGW